MNAVRGYFDKRIEMLSIKSIEKEKELIKDYQEKIKLTERRLLAKERCSKVVLIVAA